MIAMRTYTLLAAALLAAAAGCSKNTSASEGGEQTAQSAEPTNTPGTGGLAAIKVPDVNFSTAQADIDKGKDLFAQKGCNGCHKIGGGKLVGPDLKGVTARRDKQWIAKMILRPDVMTKEDPIAKDLFKTHLTQMPNQGVNPDSELAPIMSYLKSNE